MMVRVAAGLLATVLLPTAAAAQAVQPWPTLVVNAPLAPKWRMSGELVGRIAGERRPSQLETRLQVARAIGERVAIGGGWVHVVNYRPGAPDTTENQAVEQVNWTAATLGRFHLLSRTRLEQRFIGGVGATSWRFREQVRAAVGMGGARGASVVLWSEPFVALNHTAAQRRTLDQLRTFAGIAVPVSRGAELEIGYLNQRLYRPAGTIVNHAVPLILSYRF